MEQTCKRCQLFNDRDNVCAVNIVYNGESFELPVHPDDYCHWLEMDEQIQGELNNAIATAPTHYFREKLAEEKDVPIEIKQVRVWSDGKNGYIES